VAGLGWVGAGSSLCFSGRRGFFGFARFDAFAQWGWGRERREGMTRANEEINRGFVF
jgi:hypothetical protein